ncbi:MAG TPA: hypothetical protein VF669_20115 [Tepidisphaeraceae bacterium]
MPDERPVLPYATPHRRATDLISILARALTGLFLLLAAGVELYLTKIGADVATLTTLSINIAIGVLLALGGALCARGVHHLARIRGSRG